MTLNNIETHNCGALNITCEFCGAVHFAGEIGNDRKFSSCCHRGKVRFPENHYPQEFIDPYSITTNPVYANFKDKIRSYNSAFVFVLMGAAIPDNAIDSTRGLYYIAFTSCRRSKKKILSTLCN